MQLRHHNHLQILLRLNLLSPKLRLHRLLRTAKLLLHRLLPLPHRHHLLHPHLPRQVK
jgi:hypothetical protein